MFARQWIAEVILIAPPRFADARGWFSESFNAKRYADGGVDTTFIQDNHSLSHDIGTIRGLHFQIPPFAQGKLVRCVRGAIFDVAIDLRIGSSTYGQFVSQNLSAENGLQMWIPKGFAHGFATLEPHTEVEYKVDAPYSRDHERGVLWTDPDLAIPWPTPPDQAHLSPKDKDLPFLSELPVFFRAEL
ncbi:MAG: dTDP-4-dehydrorhamnose 3,5-epimerase [Pseudomonadota bacterium]